MRSCRRHSAAIAVACMALSGHHSMSAGARRHTQQRDIIVQPSKAKPRHARELWPALSDTLCRRSAWKQFQERSDGVDKAPSRALISTSRSVPFKKGLAWSLCTLCMGPCVCSPLAPAADPELGLQDLVSVTEPTKAL